MLRRTALRRACCVCAQWPERTADLPDADHADEQVAGEAAEEELREEVEHADEGALEDDGDVARVEQLDGVGALVVAVLLVTAMEGEGRGGVWALTEVRP